MPSPRTPASTHKIFRGLKSPKEKMLVAMYGDIARPATDADSTEDDEIRANVFRYVLETYSPDGSYKGINEKLELYDCLEEALRTGNSRVFYHVAKSIDAIHKVRESGWAFPDAVMLLSEYFPKPLKTKPNLWDAWGEDMIPPIKEMLSKRGKNVSEMDMAPYRRLAKALGIDLNGGKRGRPNDSDSPKTKRV